MPTSSDGRVGRVRIDRLVLRGVDMEMHDAASLPARIAVELDRRGGSNVSGANSQDVALSIAQRITAELRTQGHAP